MKGVIKKAARHALVSLAYHYGRPPAHEEIRYVAETKKEIPQGNTNL